MKPTIKREEIDGYETLEELAIDFVWGWSQNHAVGKVWERLDPDLWEKLHNPWAVLQTVSNDKLVKVLSDPSFRKMIDNLIENNQIEMNAPAWFQKNYPHTSLSHIAYFSLEYMLSDALPIYSGGLGNVAGDQLKAASDLGVPVVGVGLLYQRGYFRQIIDKEGAQHAIYPYNDPGQLPIKPLRKSNGEWIRLEVALPGWSVWLRAWEVRIGRIKLYLLDSNDAVNYPPHRAITGELYGGDSELRLKQELILGIGGWKLLKELGIEPEVCHLNEGHAAFAILERANSFMKKNNVNFEIALAATRAGNLFTTHTAVPAGFDRFSCSLIEQYLGKYAVEQLGISVQNLLALGRQNPDNHSEDFNMAYLAMRGSGAVNGVSSLHGEVSRGIFKPLFYRWPENEIPIGHITNGVHMPSWGSVKIGELWSTDNGDQCWKGTTEANISKASDTQLWEIRNDSRRVMIEFARARLARIWEARAFSPEEIERAKHLFDPRIFTIGFARRFATYKRPNMLLRDPDRLMRILTNPQRPVQLVLSGKAHPADKPGQEMMQQWIRLFSRPEARSHVIFLSDYDMHVAEKMVQGMDLWINTPRRPWEACGTSGMKVLVNGGINLSELDGWWAEAYSPKIGWALGDCKEHGEDPDWDTMEANLFYDLLEKEVVPEFYTRDAEGLPTAWLKRVRASMTTLTPRFSADRAVRDYTEKHYLPAADNFRKRSEEQGVLAKHIVNWKHALKENWSSLHIDSFMVETQKDQHVFKLHAHLNELDPNFVKVELYSDSYCVEMTRLRHLAGDAHAYIYQVILPAKYTTSDFTPRIVPFFIDVAIPLEETQIFWKSN